MKLARSTMVTAGVSAVAALAASGLTYAMAAPASEAAPAAAAPIGGGTGTDNNANNNSNNNGKGHEGDGDFGWSDGYNGRIQVNERSYSSDPGDCITVISGFGARSLNVRNDSDKTVEVFRGVVCDNGAPLATVGPHSSSYGLDGRSHDGDVKVKNGVVGSFRVVGHGHDWGGWE
ncbi:hypothetical protein [Streptomyces sp. NPDC048191]|uniref:hypothetical protein n=1 Tax=Streptomyces sp. NPDC048191 TaxID=3155484 RepID=UPI0034034979